MKIEKYREYLKLDPIYRKYLRARDVCPAYKACCKSFTSEYGKEPAQSECTCLELKKNASCVINLFYLCKYPYIVLTENRDMEKNGPH